MTHDLFGKLKYRDRDQQWWGYACLPALASVGLRTPEGPFTDEEAETMIADMALAIEDMKKLIREQMGDRADAALEQIDRATAEAERTAGDDLESPPDPAEEERARKRAERDRKHASRLARGLFLIGINAPTEAEPTVRQEASFRFLQEHEPAVLQALLQRVWESFQNAYGQENWRRIMAIKPAQSLADLSGRFALTRLEIARESRGGFAHLVFQVDSDWQDEQGLLIVYSPDTRAAVCTNWDELDDHMPSDDPEDHAEDDLRTPHDESLEAILSGNEAEAIKLIASGADINALRPGEYPPLWVAVDQMDVDAVRRLVEFGADPNLTSPDDKTTPLRHARKLYREMGFAPRKNKDSLMDSILSIARELGGKQFDEIKQRLEEIIAILEAAARK